MAAPATHARRTRRTLRRSVLVLVTVVGFVVASERPAAAHGSGGVRATNYETTLDGTSPELAGVTVRLIEAGSRLELRNDGPDLVVLGHDGEPYLRVGPGGAFENRQSPTLERNHRSSHAPPTPGRGDPSAPPEWRKLSDERVVRWHQHSTHWMAPRDPPQVEAAPGQRHVVYPRWEIRLRQGDATAVVFGKLTWVPGPSPAPWFGLMTGTFLAVGALGLLKRWGRPLAAATALIVTSDIIHAVAVAFAYAGGLGTHLAKLLGGSFYAFVGWGLAAVAIRLLGKDKVDGLYAAIFAGLSMAVFGGLLDLAKLYRTVSLSALPPDTARLFVTLSAGGGLGLAAASLLIIQRTPDARRVIGGPDEEDEQPDTEGAGAPI